MRNGIALNYLPFEHHPLQEVYSRSTLQILSAYRNRQGVSPGAWDPAPVTEEQGTEAGLLKKEAGELWKLALEENADDYLGLNAGPAFAKQIKGHFLIALAANSRTAGEALTNICHYHEVCFSTPHPVIKCGDHTTSITHPDLAEFADPEVRRHITECLFSAIVEALNSLCGHAIYPETVFFEWPAPQSTDAYEQVFGAPVHFKAGDNSLVFSNHTLNTAIPYADEFLLSTLTQYADNQLSTIRRIGSWSNIVNAVVHQLGLPAGLEIRTVAAELFVSPRTLQDKLKSEGTSYQSIIRELKVRKAKEYLSTSTLPLSEIALLLGYSEQSAFNHAFRNWTGLTPRQFRQSHLKLRFD